MNKLFLSLLILGLAAQTFALYGDKSKVFKLTAANFNEKVIRSNELWLVEFYAPWCGHCKNLAPEWEKAANALDGIVNIGAVDMTTDQAAGSAYNIQGFPTIKFFGANKQSAQDYNGGRTAKDIVSFAIDSAKKVANDRLGIKGGSSNSGSNSNSGGSGSGGSCGGGGGAGAGAGGSGGSCGGGGGAGHGSGSGSGSGSSDDKDVIVLEDGNFNENVMNSKDGWFVEFYAPWCGHCKNLAPEWNKLATDLKGEIKVAKVDATVNSQSGQRFKVNGYPSIKFFPPGCKNDDCPIDYSGSRDSGSMASWAKEQLATAGPVKFIQLTSKAVYQEYCGEFKGVCIIAFVPHIYDSSADERNGYLKVIEDIAHSNRGKPYTFLWSQGGDQYAMEDLFAVAGSGYPSVVAISSKKNVYAVMRAAFNKDSVANFIKNLVAGKGGFIPYNEAI